MVTNGVFCLEGEWDADLRKRTSVLPVLELLERLGAIKAIHRKVATAGEVEHYLNLWGQARYDDYLVLYLAAHGYKGSLNWSNRNDTSLDDLAEMLGESAAGCYIHLGSCLTLFNEKEASSFVERTGVRALLGFPRRGRLGRVGGLRDASSAQAHRVRTDPTASQYLL